MQARSPATAEQLGTALIGRYVKDDDPGATVDDEGAIALVGQLPANAVAPGTTLAAAIAAHHPDAILPARARAVVASIDDCLKMIFSIMSVEPAIDAELRRAVPAVAAQLIRAPQSALNDQPSALTVLDKLADASVGWTEGLGRTGDKVLETVTGSIERLYTGTDVAALDAELQASFDKDQNRINKLEERLAASETGRLRTQQSRAFAAAMINKAIDRKKLTPAIAHFLKGPWFDSAQLVVLTKGLESEDWSRMKALTETIVWTYQPILAIEEDTLQKERQRLYRIVEHLPGEVRELLLALEHDTGAAEAALEDIEQDHVMLVSGQELVYEDFDLIETGADEGARPTVSRMLLRKLRNFEPGQWFQYRSDEFESRIKLLLKLDDVKLMLFTNRNGMKVMQRSFEEFAYLLSSGVVKPLRTGNVFSGTFRTFYEGLIEEHQRQQQRIAERKAELDREQEEREAAREKALREAADLERQQEEEARQARLQAREKRLEEAKQALAEADPELVDTVTGKVADLAVGAWLKLPGADGQLVDCKLAVKISATDKLIFVSQSGTKVGEYTSDEMIRLLVAGQGEIQDEGVEFEDTLQQVVSRLRQDKNKSYDDLTGE